MKIFSVTPLLSVSSEPVPNAIRALTLVDAVLLIEQGEHVVVGTLTIAKEVLCCLGLPEDEAEDRLHFAVTGQVLAS